MEKQNKTLFIEEISIGQLQELQGYLKQVLEQFKNKI